jgi:folylpolyglutamate synthase/dihydropteroate synthase
MEEVGDAFETAVHEKKEDEYLFCIGSLYLVGEIQRIIDRLLESEDML